jgi:hypothetical protein
MTTQNESETGHSLEDLRCKVELLEDKIGRQQALINRLRQEVSSRPLADLPAFIYASTSRETNFAREWLAPFMVSIAVVTVVGVLALVLWGS